MNVRDVLGRKRDGRVESIGVHETVATLIERLAARNIGALVVTDGEGRLAGVISERDIVRAMASDRDRCLSNPVSTYMTKDVVTARPTDDTENVLERMTKGRFRHMPVLEGEEMVGVISIGDVVKARIDVLQRDNAALEEFIRG